LPLAACAGGAPLSPDAQGPGGTLARVQLVTTRSLPDGTAQAEAEARFLRYTGVGAADAATLSGLASPDTIPGGSCALFDPTASVDAALAKLGGAGEGGLDLELLAAGPLSFRVGGALGVELAAQRTPDLLPFLSGVEYGSRVPMPADPLDNADVTFAAPGAPGADSGDALGPFGASGTLPPDVRLVSVAGDDPTAGSVVAPAGSWIEVRWQPDAAALPSDAVYVELRALPQSAAELVCRVADSGEFQFPAASASQLPDRAQADGSVWIAVLRTRTTPLTLPGLGSSASELVLGSREGVPVTLQ